MLVVDRRQNKADPSESMLHAICNSSVIQNMASYLKLDE